MSGLLPLYAQDEQRVKSPDTQLEFRIFVSHPPERLLDHLGYEVYLAGKPLLETSYLGYDVHNQEPFLGENIGFMSAAPSKGPNYNGILLRYMQNGTTGRSLSLEVRVYNDGVAFRYLVPPTALLLDLQIEDEITEFSFPIAITAKDPVSLPFEIEESNRWIGIYESEKTGFPKSRLVHNDPNTLITRLIQPDVVPRIAYETETPFTGPWRIIAIAPTRAQLSQTQVVKDILGK